MGTPAAMIPIPAIDDSGRAMSVVTTNQIEKVTNRSGSPSLLPATQRRESEQTFFIHKNL